MNIWYVLLLLFGLSLLLTLMGFKKFVYFLSLGYGLAIAGCGITLIITYAIQVKINITGLLACILFVVYGVRLSGFLLIRELKSASYRKVFKEVSTTEKPMPFFLLLIIWITVAVLYVLEVSGVTFMLQNNAYDSFFDFGVVEIVGLVIMVTAIIIESVADSQKSNAKKIEPHKVVTTGLYRVCRCPNYYGEILFWTGVFVFSILSLKTWYEWVFVILGYISIVYVMLNGAKRLENRQDKNYGNEEYYIEYVKKTPIIVLLFIPIFHLRKSKLIK